MSQEELEKSIQEIWELFKETDRRLDQRIEETDRRLDQRIEETDRRLDLRIEETDQRLDKRFSATDQRMQITDRQIRDLSKQIGGLGNKFGSFAEGMAFPSMRRILFEHFKMDRIFPNALVRQNGEELELDVLAFSDGAINQVFVVEVKSRLRETDLDEMQEKLKKIPRFFPEHQNKAIYGIIAAIDINEEMKTRILNAGIYLALIKDDTFTLVTSENFSPRRFN